MRSQGKPLFPHSPPGNCCKIPSRLMANAQSMLRAQAGAAANETLDATAARAGEGLGSWGEGCQAPAPAGFSLAPSEPVSAGLQHLGRGAQSPGEARPLPQHSACVLKGLLSQGCWTPWVQMRPGCPPDSWPPSPGGRGWGPGS
uniref:Uncharacterized protein n=1 Tax=Sus scrofa TaxID=9823 RepID=A0A8D0JW23_PIG